MTNQRTPTQLSGRPGLDAPTPAHEPRGFFDCRGEWQDLEDGDDDAAS